MRILSFDMGWSNSVSCLLDSDRGEVHYQSLPTLAAKYEQRMEQTRPDVVVIEAGPLAGWVKDLCDRRGQRLLVLNTNDEPWQWRKVKHKSDRKDACKLCRLVILEQGSAVHVPSHAVRQWRQLIYYRQTLVDEMVSIKNRLRAVLLQEQRPLPDGKKAWGGTEYQRLRALGLELGACQDDELWRGMVKLELERLEQLQQQLEQVEQKLNAIGRVKEAVKRLQQAPGVGARTAELVVAMIDDAKRFGRGREVASYGGFTPTKFASGKTDRDGRISRAGNGLLRKYLVQAAWSGKRNCPQMQAIYRRVRRDSPKRAKQAIVAVARHLLVWLWAMLRDGTDWREHGRVLTPSLSAA